MNVVLSDGAPPPALSVVSAITVGPRGYASAASIAPSTEYSGGAACSRRAISSRPISSASLRSEEHTFELQSRQYLVCRLLLEKKKENSHTKNTNCAIQVA